MVSRGNRTQTFGQLIGPALDSVGQIRDRRRYDPNTLDLVCILATNWTLNLKSKTGSYHLSCCRGGALLISPIQWRILGYVAHNEAAFILTHG